MRKWERLRPTPSQWFIVRLRDTVTPGHQGRKEGPKGWKSIRGNASAMEALRVHFRENRDICAHHDIVTWSSNCCTCRTVFHLLLVLSKSESLCSHELATLLLDPAKATFAGCLMLLCSHLNVVWWKAACTVISKKRAVPSIEDINFWIRQFRVLMSIGGTVLLADEFGPMSSKHWLRPHS